MSDKFKKPKTYPLGWAILSLLAMLGLDRWLHLQQLFPPPLNLAGALLTVPGLAILLQSGLLFIKAKNGLLPFSNSSSLVTTGPYRYSRNPMYLAMVMLLLGVAVFLGSLGAVIPVLIYVLIIDWHFIRKEEFLLEEMFGEEYLAYKRHVRRWI